MIKIDTSQIKNWEEIKKLHLEWYKEYIYPKIEITFEILKNEENNLIKSYNNVLKNILDKKEYYIIDNFIGNKNNDLIDKFARINLEELKKELNKIDLNKLSVNKKLNFLKIDDFKDIVNKYREKKILILELERYININKLKIKELKEKPVKRLKKGTLINLKKKSSYFYICEGKKEFYPENLFDYDSFSTKSEGWNRHRLISMMGISVCPYCQRQYITNYKENDGDKENNRTTSDLDHFISKSKCPILALCLYNFIPSCQICNSRFKGQDDSYKEGKLQVLYPYEESYDDYGVKFKTSIELLENIIGEDKKFEVKIDSSQLEENLKKSKEEVLSVEERINNDIDMFGLNKVYKDSHNGYLKDMLKTIEKTPESYLNIISDLFVDEEEKNKEDEKEEKLKQSFQEIVKEPYKFKIRNGEPLGKLTKDIAEEFGIDMGEE